MTNSNRLSLQHALVTSAGRLLGQLASHKAAAAAAAAASCHAGDRCLPPAATGITRSDLSLTKHFAAMLVYNGNIFPDGSELSELCYEVKE